ncbi:hypothetical protein [Pseudomonas sp. KNUC1026]|uniref:hypothetical protein n=1 Tax=Pseudomonas sp. KNUC1026 TaxID=2893890 RepID=UPI001F400A8C|nr:hypothetical protein [Pseudomonas sp. KNUC1026]UFH51805.1 hypothetical protein LN139_21500 [Pseudomonas sp. KNUC1026]
MDSTDIGKQMQAQASIQLGGRMPAGVEQWHVIILDLCVTGSNAQPVDNSVDECCTNATMGW